MIRQHQKSLNLIHRVLDCVSVAFSLAVSIRIQERFFSETGSYGAPDSPLLVFAAFLLISLLHLLCYQGFHVYRSYRNVPFWIQAVDTAKANLTAYGILAAVFYQFSLFVRVQVVLTVFFFLNQLVQIFLRAAVYGSLLFLRKKGYNRRYVLLLGENPVTSRLLEKIRNSPGFGYEVLGCIAPLSPKAPVSWLGKPDILEEYLQKTLVDEVFLMLREEDGEQTARYIDLLEKYGVKFSVIPGAFSLLPDRMYLTAFDGMPVLGMRRIPLDSLWNSFCKRAFDIVVSLFCLVLFSPILALAALWVRLDSPGPVIFRQVRVGLDRRPFVMYKLRSMRVETESMIAMAKEGDPRCTRSGAFLRKYSIDELPQLWNVLRGDMSLVGPRPEIPSFVETFREEIPSYMLKHYIRPGMTGLAQIRGLRGGGTSIPERVRCDMEYIENWSFGLDLSILFRTAFRLRAVPGKEEGA